MGHLKNWSRSAGLAVGAACIAAVGVALSGLGRPAESPQPFVPTLDQRAYFAYLQFGLSQPPSEECFDLVPSAQTMGACEDAAGAVAAAMKRALGEVGDATKIRMTQGDDKHEDERVQALIRE